MFQQAGERSTVSKLVPDAPHAALTYSIIGAAMQVHNELGPGHREAVYQRGLLVKLPQPPYCLSLEAEPKLPVYDSGGALLYLYNPDFIVEAAVIVETKAHTHPLTNDDVAQVFDYFAASHYTVALLINFGRPRLEYKRLFSPKHIQARRRGQPPP
jgi:GxxExxY protein